MLVLLTITPCTRGFSAEVRGSRDRENLSCIIYAQLNKMQTGRRG